MLCLSPLRRLIHDTLLLKLNYLSPRVDSQPHSTEKFKLCCSYISISFEETVICITSHWSIEQSKTTSRWQLLFNVLHCNCHFKWCSHLLLKKKNRWNYASRRNSLKNKHQTLLSAAVFSNKQLHSRSTAVLHHHQAFKLSCWSYDGTDV